MKFALDSSPKIPGIIVLILSFFLPFPSTAVSTEGSTSRSRLLPVNKTSLTARPSQDRQDVSEQAGVLHLSFQPRITTEAKTLGELLVIQNDSRHWSQKSLQSHPGAGQLLQRETLVSWMESQFGPFEWQWQGPVQQRVESLATSSNQQAIHLAKNALLNQLKPHYNRVQLKVLKQSQGITGIKAPLKTRMDIHFPTAKRVCVWLINQQVHKPVWFEVKAYQSVRVAKNTLPAGTVLGDKQFSWQERNIAGLKSKPASKIGKRQRIKKTLPAQDILLADNLESIPDVIHGQRVQVVVRHKSVQLITEAVALKDGYQGQILPLKNTMNQQSFMAKITGIQKAEIVL